MDIAHSKAVADMQAANQSVGSHVRTYHYSCPICRKGAVNYKFTTNGFTIVKCPSCKLMFVKEKLSQQELDYYYGKNTEDTDTDDDFVYLNQENIGNLNYYYRNLRSLILERISTGSILDIGCSGGYFLDVMEGFKLFGVERSPGHGKIAKRKYGDNIFIGAFEEYKPPDFLFDCISIQDVLDHMVDPLGALKKCNKLLKPGGTLVVKVHDMSSLYAKIMGRNFYAFIPPRHLFFFNRFSIAMALKEASFDIVLSKHMAHLMFLSTIIYRLSREDQRSIFFHLYKLIKGTCLGHLKIYKNLHEIITILAIKK